MKKLAFLLLLFFSYSSYSQLYDGQKFCESSEGYSYFPLEIMKKKLFWYDTFYLETNNGTKVINGKTYIEFKQVWKDDKSDLFYLREENGIVYEYDECCQNETVRYNPNFEIGHTWKSVSGKNEYRIIAYDGKLKTPFCDYENLLVMEAKMFYGTYTFYYLKGHGYIGATKDNKLISCVTPIM